MARLDDYRHEHLTRLQSDIEDIIDATDLATTLRMISAICYAKGIHLIEDWQDRGSAKLWEKMGDKIGVLADRSYV